MTTSRQIWFPGAIYYILSHTRKQERIFYEEDDYRHFLASLETIRYQYPFYLHSYCLTSHHVHLLLETTHIPITDIVVKINQLYMQYFECQYHEKLLFDQLKTTLIASADSFLKASKYIHLTPLRTQLETDIKAYRWSSYLSFISHFPNDHVVTSRILTYFQEPKMRNYLFYVETEEKEVQTHKKEEIH